MQALIPNKLKILSTTAPREDYPDWDEAAIYAPGDRVIDDDHYIYEAVAVPAQEDFVNAGYKPSGNSDLEGAPWRTLSISNQWACIDVNNYTQTLAGEGEEELVIEVPFARPATGFGLLNMDASDVSVKIYKPGNAGGEDEGIWESGVLNLLEDSVSLWNYFFDPFRLLKDIAVTGLPPFSGNMRVTLHGGSPAIGTIIVGEHVLLGETQYGPTFGFKDYSISTTNDFGNVYYVERKKAKIGTFSVFIPPKNLDYVQQRVMDIGSRPTLWIGDDGAGFQSMVIFGRLKEYTPSLAAVSKGEATFDIEGFI